MYLTRDGAPGEGVQREWMSVESRPAAAASACLPALFQRVVLTKLGWHLRGLSPLNVAAHVDSAGRRPGVPGVVSSGEATSQNPARTLSGAADCFQPIEVAASQPFRVESPPCAEMASARFGCEEDQNVPT